MQFFTFISNDNNSLNESIFELNFFIIIFISILFISIIFILFILYYNLTNNETENNIIDYSKPKTPPPIITTLAGAVPGTPPIRIPIPP